MVKQVLSKRATNGTKLKQTETLFIALKHNRSAGLRTPKGKTDLLPSGPDGTRKYSLEYSLDKGFILDVQANEVISKGLVSTRTG